MGMYDYVRCEMSLPGDPPARLNGAWQTKDTPAQMLETYTIRSDGSLWLTRADEAERVEDFHGDLNFYTGDSGQGWWEYVARFTDGRCVRIKLVERPAPTPAEDASQ